MTRQKSFKRLVRQRMAKTGESYATARSMLLSSPASEPEPVLVVPDDRIRERTGRGWEEWFDTIDSWDAETMSHTEIARKVAAELGLHPLAWNVQAVTTSFERARGRKEVGERDDGFAATVTRTIAAPAARLFDAFVHPAARSTWLNTDRLAVRTATRPRSARFDWGDDGSRVHVTVDSKGDDKATISIEHRRLPDARTMDEMKAMWRSSLDQLKHQLEGGERNA